MSCPHCGSENPAGKKLCGDCGGALENRCPQCGAENPPNKKFCGDCGVSLADPSSVAAGFKPASGGVDRRAAEHAGLKPAATRGSHSPRDYTPRHLADKILQSKSALEGERKQVTVLFADVKGSMELAEQLDPEQWHTILDRFFAILTDGVHRFEGTVNQYTGDGIMALFGAPIAHEDHAQRACYAALYLRDEIARYATEVKRAHSLHWLDDASGEFLAHMVDARAGSRNLLLLNFRPEYRAEWMQKSWYRQIPLTPLGKEAIAELLADLLGADPSIAALVGPIHARTGGNPFFTEEVAQTLIESGHLEGQRGAYRLVTQVERLEVPATVQAVLSARIDRLPEREKRLLQTASVIGKDFAEPLLAELALYGRVEKQIRGLTATLLAEALLQAGDPSAAQTAAEEAIMLCRRTLRGTYEIIAHGVLARALLRRDGAAARVAAEAALASAAELIERTGAKTLAPALGEWRAKLAGVLGDDVTCAQLLRQAQQGYDEIGAPGHAERVAQLLAESPR